MPEELYRFHSKLDGHHVHELHALYQGEWWTRGRSLEEVRRMLAHSDLIFAISDRTTDRLIAFARVLTDGVFKALLFDVIVAPNRRAEGLGRRLMDWIIQAPDLKSVRHIELYCLPEMVAFYEKWGFSTEISGVMFMRRSVNF